MKLNNAIKILEHHQEWRLGNNNIMLEPKTISNAIYAVLNHTKGNVKELLFDYTKTFDLSNEEINSKVNDYLNGM